MPVVLLYRFAKCPRCARLWPGSSNPQCCEFGLTPGISGGFVATGELRRQGRMGSWKDSVQLPRCRLPWCHVSSRRRNAVNFRLMVRCGSGLRELSYTPWLDLCCLGRDSLVSWLCSGAVLPIAADWLTADQYCRLGSRERRSTHSVAVVAGRSTKWSLLGGGVVWGCGRSVPRHGLICRRCHLGERRHFRVFRVVVPVDYSTSR